MDRLRDKVEARAARRRATRAAVPVPASGSPEDRPAAPTAPARPVPGTGEDAVGTGEGVADGGEVAAATFGRIMAEGGSDPVIGRAIIRLFNLLTLPHELLADAELVARVAPLLARPPQPRPEPEGPRLEELLA
jgi:hypothetical protein